MGKSKVYTKIIAIFIGLVFILSASLKLFSLESVDLFFYEHRVFNWTLTTILSRLLICTEAVLGIMLVFGVYPKIGLYISQLFLVLFTIYIFAKPYIFTLSQENCYCFGEIIALNDKQTIYKNIILLLLSLLLVKYKAKKLRKSKLILILSIISVGLTVFIVKPPDIISNKIYNRGIEINHKAMQEVFDLEEVKSFDLRKGRKMLCFYSTHCKYCSSAARKIDVIRQRNNISSNSIFELYWGNPDSVDKVHKNKDISYAFISPGIFLDATKNRQPVIILLENGEIIKTYKLTTLNERYIGEFFK